MNNLNRPFGVTHGHRVRNVSQKVFSAELGPPQLDETELLQQVERAVNAEAWSPGEVLIVATTVPPETAKQMLEWLSTFGIRAADLVDAGTVHACEGAWFHEDSDVFADSFFSVMWLEETDAWDLLFPQSNIRIPLHKGTTVLFDPAHVHGVVARGMPTFEATELGDMGVQAFASLNLKTSPRVMRLFESSWSDPGTTELDLRWNQAPNAVCQLTGQTISFG